MTVRVNIELQRNEIRDDQGVVLVVFNWNHARAEYVSDRGEPLGKSWGEAVDAAKRLPEERRHKSKRRR